MVTSPDAHAIMDISIDVNAVIHTPIDVNAAHDTLNVTTDLVDPAIVSIDPDTAYEDIQDESTGNKLLGHDLEHLDFNNNNTRYQ